MTNAAVHETSDSPGGRPVDCPRSRSAARGRRARALLLALLALACASPPEGAGDAPARASWSAVSQSGRLRGRLAPETGPVAVGPFQTWILELRTATGEAVAGAQIGIDGGMPAHGHGLPTQPRVTAELAEGRYRIEGVKLNMYGDWVFLFDVRTATLSERLRFDVSVDY